MKTVNLGEMMSTTPRKNDGKGLAIERQFKVFMQRSFTLTFYGLSVEIS